MPLSMEPSLMIASSVYPERYRTLAPGRPSKLLDHLAATYARHDDIGDHKIDFSLVPQSSG